MKLTSIALDVLDPPAHAHRLTIDQAALDELALDIDTNGLHNPIQVQRRGQRYEVIAGHRRYLAHRQLRRVAIDAFVIPPGANGAASALRFAENMHREQLTPMEEAYALRRELADTKTTPDKLARRLSRPSRWIADRLALTELPAPLQEALHQKQIPTGAALVLAEVDDPEHLRYLLAHASASGASVAVIRSWIGDYFNQRAAAGTAALPAPDFSQAPRAAIVMMQCACCDKAHDHLDLTIMRVCAECAEAIHK